LTLRAGDQRRVAEAVRRLGRVAFIGAPSDGWIPVFDAASDEQDEDEIMESGKGLTRELGTSGLAVLVHDGDELCYWLFDRGTLVDKYESWPGYHEGQAPSPEGGDPDTLCRVLGVRCDPADVRAVLHELTDHADALFIHESLAKALGMPQSSIGLGYGYLEQGDPSDSPDDAAFRAGLGHVGDEEDQPRTGPRAVPPPAPADSRAQFLPFVKPGSAPEADLVVMRATMMDEVADKLIGDGGTAAFLEFLDERLASVGDDPASLRSLQAQVPFLLALSRRSSEASFRARVDDLLKAIAEAS